MLLQVKEIIHKSSNGDKIIIDADQGKLYLRPQTPIYRSYMSKLKLRNKAKNHLALKNLETKTIDKKKLV